MRGLLLILAAAGLASADMELRKHRKHRHHHRVSNLKQDPAPKEAAAAEPKEAAAEPKEAAAEPKEAAAEPKEAAAAPAPAADAPAETAAAVPETAAPGAAGPTKEVSTTEGSIMEKMKNLESRVCPIFSMICLAS